MLLCCTFFAQNRQSKQHFIQENNKNYIISKNDKKDSKKFNHHAVIFVNLGLKTRFWGKMRFLAFLLIKN